MTKSIVTLKYRRGRRGPSARTLRRAVQPNKNRIGLRAIVFLVFMSLLMGVIAISLNLRLEAWEFRHPQHSDDAKL